MATVVDALTALKQQCQSAIVHHRELEAQLEHARAEDASLREMLAELNALVVAMKQQQAAKKNGGGKQAPQGGSGGRPPVAALLDSIFSEE